jgi:hypothetical protein
MSRIIRLPSLQACCSDGRHLHVINRIFYSTGRWALRSAYALVIFFYYFLTLNNILEQALQLSFKLQRS